VWSDETAEQVAAPDHLPMRLVVAVCGETRKAVSSRDGMRVTRDTSPYHRAWIEQCGRDLEEALRLLRSRDLPGLGALAERNALRMHADALAADPPLLYWAPATVACLQQVQRLRDGGIGAWSTIDAGPHVVVICAPDHAQAVEAAVRATPGVRDVVVCAPAGGARVTERGADARAQ
jgi:diphosphomevalonate decarboxylase